MNAETPTNTPTEARRDRKKAYASPRLIVYGEVRSLTQAQTGLALEAVIGPLGHPSDRRVKEHIVEIGVHPLGIGLYLFDYRAEYREQWGHGRQFGVMADEVEAVMPAAISVHPDGYKLVDYAKLGIARAVH